MERVLIVNADDFGLSKGQNYGIIEACRNGVVTSTTEIYTLSLHDALTISSAVVDVTIPLRQASIMP